jgi:hypothetical protein
MNMTQWPEIAPYRLGDMARIRCDEPDPEPGWAEATELQVHGIRSIRYQGALVASFGYVPVTRFEVDSFAVVDRHACAPIARHVTALIRRQCCEWMLQYGFTTVTASCAAQDLAARVFLRAIGYRETKPSDGDISHFTFTRSK